MFRLRTEGQVCGVTCVIRPVTMQTRFTGSLLIRTLRTQALAAALMVTGCDDDSSPTDAAAVDAALDAMEDRIDAGAMWMDATPDNKEAASDGGLLSDDGGASAGAFSKVCSGFNPDASAGGVALSSETAIGWRVHLDRGARIRRLAISVEGNVSYQDAAMPEIALGLVRLSGPNDEPDRPLLAGPDTVVTATLPLPRTNDETVLAVTFGVDDGVVVAAGWYAILVTTNVGDSMWLPLTVPTQDPVANTRCQDGSYPFSISATGSLTLQSASPHLVLEGDLL